MSYTMNRFVLAHELGHAVLHNDNGSKFFIDEYTCFAPGKFELEANKFAANLLINEKNLKDLLGGDLSSIASELEVPVQLVKIKIGEIIGHTLW